jgi:hypothetical protein
MHAPVKQQETTRFAFSGRQSFARIGDARFALLERNPQWRIVVKIPLLTTFVALMTFGQISISWKTLVKEADERQECDDLAGAAALRWDALRGAQQQLGVNSPELVPLSAQLAGPLHLARRVAEAEPVLHRAVEIATESGDPKLLGIALSGLATVLQGEGDPARAEPVLRRGLTLLRQSEGDDALERPPALLIIWQRCMRTPVSIPKPRRLWLWLCLFMRRTIDLLTPP